MENNLDFGKKNNKTRKELKVRYGSQFKVIKKNSNFVKLEVEESDDGRKPREIESIIPLIEEEEDHNKELFIYFTISNEGIRQWYKINPNPNETSTSTGKTQIQFLSQICCIPADILPRKYSTIGFNSKLYVMGGYAGKQDLGNRGQIKRSVRSKVFVFDTLSTNPNPVWEECRSMKSCKIRPQLAVADGQIFAFGSRPLINFCTKKPFAEVFDPLLNKWTALPSPPPDVHLGNVADNVFMKDRDEIIIFPYSYSYTNPRDAYRFNVKTHLWTTFTDPFQMHTDHFTTSVAVGDVVFRLQQKQLYACDLSKPKPIGHCIYGLEKEIESLPYSGYHLLYIGNGKLCLTWCFDSQEHCDMTVIACLKFWVGMCNQKRRLQAIIDRCDHYLAKGSSVTLNCFAM